MQNNYVFTPLNDEERINYRKEVLKDVLTIMSL